MADPDPYMNNACRVQADARVAAEWAADWDDTANHKLFKTTDRIILNSTRSDFGDCIGLTEFKPDSHFNLKVFEIYSRDHGHIGGAVGVSIDDYLEVKTGVDSISGWPELARKGDWSPHYGSWLIYYTAGLEYESDSELTLK